MYAHFYQLSENPFNLTPDPKFHYVNASTREAMASILHGVKSRKGFLTLIAEAGTGKTTLLKRIVDEIEGEAQVVFVFNPGVSFDELLEFICSELGIETHGCKRLHLLDRLNSHLLEQLTRGRNVVVMIDEAQTLEDSVLEELRLLSNLETAKEKILQILLSGQPELEEKLRKPTLRQLRQRIGVRATLKPVRLDEMAAYVETRLRSAGAERNDLFTQAALKRIWQASNGIPRVINVICDNAMMLAFADGRKRITPKLLREAVRDLEGDVPAGAFGSGAPEWLSSRVIGYALAAAAVVAAAIPLATVAQRGLHSQQLAMVGEGDVRANPTRDLTISPPPAASRSQMPESTHRAGQGGADPESEKPSDGLGAVAEGRDADDEQASIRALESDPSGRPAIVDSMRRAELFARSTAARLYGTDQDREAATQRRDITDTALDEVAHDGGRRAPAVIVPPAAAAAASEDVDENVVVPSAAPAIAAQEQAAAAAELAAKAETAAREAAASKEAAAAKEAAAKKDAEAKKIAAAKKEAEAATRAAEQAAAAEREAAAEEREAAAAGAEVASAAPTPEEVRAAVERVAGGTPENRATDAVPVDPARTAAVPHRAFTLGRVVTVANGDTVWDIAMKNYGSAGPSVLKRILVSNPAVRDPLRLEVGSMLFLPYGRPDEMVHREASGFRVLLASGTSRERLEELGRWARTIAGEVNLTSSTVGTGAVLYELSVSGISSEAQALRLATNLLENASASAAERTAMR